MYCTAEEVRQMIKADLLSALIGDEYIDDPAEREARITPIIEQAIADAEAEADGYLAKRYPVPLARTPAVINKYVKDIAIYNLISRIGVDDSEREANYRERYKFAIKFLGMVAKGEVEIGVAVPAKQAATGFRMTGPERLFSRDKLRGM